MRWAIQQESCFSPVLSPPQASPPLSLFSLPQETTGKIIEKGHQSKSGMVRGSKGPVVWTWKHAEGPVALPSRGSLGPAPSTTPTFTCPHRDSDTHLLWEHCFSQKHWNTDKRKGRRGVPLLVLLETTGSLLPPVQPPHLPLHSSVGSTSPPRVWQTVDLSKEDLFPNP